ncbi:hypothetical protein ANCCAN_07371 [Ancylostoma caninum]|uniref:Uncharacterized protein n=1 Tax=Ancylostoma caninum TaxID=29170 RepID=A0A368GUF4_ANCCA|nr:hypothetical protein ANCCAN_07371 [Ancylostoma caninum]
MPHLLRELNEAIALTFNSFETIRGRYQKPYEEYVDIQSLQQQTSLSLAHFHALLSVVLKAYLVALSVFVCGWISGQCQIKLNYGPCKFHLFIVRCPRVP